MLIAVSYLYSFIKFEKNSKKALKEPLPSKLSLILFHEDVFKPEEFLIGNKGSLMNLTKKATAESIDKCSFSLCLEICP